MGGQAVVLDPGAGRSVSLRGTEVVFKVESRDAAGASCVEFTAAAGFDTGIHVHQRLEETFYVLDGAFESGSARTRSGQRPGRACSCPPGFRTRSPIGALLRRDCC